MLDPQETPPFCKQSLFVGMVIPARVFVGNVASAGRVSNPWRLGFILDLFWAIINGIGMLCVYHIAPMHLLGTIFVGTNCLTNAWLCAACRGTRQFYYDRRRASRFPRMSCAMLYSRVPRLSRTRRTKQPLAAAVAAAAAAAAGVTATAVRRNYMTRSFMLRWPTHGTTRAQVVAELA